MTPSKFKARLLFISAPFALGLAVIFCSPSAQTQAPAQVKADDEAYREYMQTMTRQLGTTCNSCHNVKNWKSDEKENFKTAKEHIRFVQALIDNGMNGERGRPKADCYMCHRGVMKPAYKEKFDPLTMKNHTVKKGSAESNERESE